MTHIWWLIIDDLLKSMIFHQMINVGEEVLSVYVVMFEMDGHSWKWPDSRYDHFRPRWTSVSNDKKFWWFRCCWVKKSLCVLIKFWFSRSSRTFGSLRSAPIPQHDTLRKKTQPSPEIGQSTSGFSISGLFNNNFKICMNTIQDIVMEIITKASTQTYISLITIRRSPNLFEDP